MTRSIVSVPHWHVGCNTPGYLPMADEPFICLTADGAKQSLIGDINRAGDAIFDAGETSDERAIADEYSSANEDLNLANVADGYDVTLPTMLSEHDLGCHYWIVRCTEECESEDDY